MNILKKSFILKTYPIFRNRNFRLYFYGQLISFAGNWLQNVAQGWLVLEITHSAYWVGFIYALPLFVGAALSPFGGIIADKFNKKKILYWTQLLGMAQAFFLGVLVITHHADLWVIGVLAFMLGVINAVDISTRQSFVTEIVDTEHIRSAATLNGALQTAAQVIGPGLGGFLIAYFGTGWTFIINGLTFIPVWIFLVMINYRHIIDEGMEHPIKMFISGISYTLTNSKILLCVLLAGFIPMFGYSFRAILPVITTDIFKGGPEILGYLGSAAGVGSCLGALIISTESKSKFPFNVYIVSGSLITGIALVLFSFVSNLYLGLLLLFLAGVGFTVSYSMARAEFQTVTESRMRGRVGGILVMFFFLGMAVGNYLAGFLAENWGTGVALRINGSLLLIITVIAYFTIPKIYARSKIILT